METTTKAPRSSGAPQSKTQSTEHQPEKLIPKRVMIRLGDDGEGTTQLWREWAATLEAQGCAPASPTTLLLEFAMECLSSRAGARPTRDIYAPRRACFFSIDPRRARSRMGPLRLPGQLFFLARPCVWRPREKRHTLEAIDLHPPRRACIFNRSEAGPSF